jgi:4-amino-4-deoxychorismate lyase
MLCWMNGDFEQADKLRISPFDHGFLYGAGFFETFRTYEGRVFLFKEHMERILAALDEYRIDMPYSEEDILQAIQGLHDRSGGRDGYYRLNVSAGMHDIGLTPSEYKSPNVILFRKELAVVPRGTEKKAVWLETERNLPESRVRHKSHNFLNNVRGRLELPSLKELEGIFLTAHGHVAEGVTSNVFWVKDGALYTPSVETGILPGITRSFILESGEKIGMAVHVGLYTKREVEQADEVFVSNSVQELVPLSVVGERSLPGASGIHYQKLHHLYVQAIDGIKEG